MPKPVFIVVSQSGVEDRQTNLLSLFNVIERLVIKKKPAKEDAGEPGQFKEVNAAELPAMHFGFRIAAVWMLEQSDPPEGTLDAEMVFSVPPHNREVRHSMGPLEYKKGSFIVRVSAIVIGPPPCDGSGILRVKIRVRFSDTLEWLEQEYPILIETIDETVTDSNDPAPPSPN